MRIVDVAEFYADAGGGVKTYINAKLRAGSEQGHELLVIAPGKKDLREVREGGQVFWIQSPAMPGDSRYHLFSSQAKVSALLDELKPDVIEGSSPYGGAWFASGWGGSAVRSFVFHQDPVAALAHPLLDRHISRPVLDRLAAPVWSYLRRLSRRFDTTVVAGHWLAERLSEFGLQNVEAVPFGIDPIPFFNAEPSPQLRAHWLNRMHIPPAVGTLLIAVSRHHPEKRLPVLIQAMQHLPETFGLVIYGDGPIRAHIEREAAHSPRVAIAGYTQSRPALATAMRSADIFVHGSAAETFGLVVNEALAAGLPIVVPHAGGAGELAQPAFAETYPPGNPEACAAAILQLVARGLPSVRNAVSNHAPKIRTLNTHFVELFGHYRDLCSQRTL
ncbi:MAG: glycosyltransferase [Myxococcales bacterium]|nr:glycosyltransferase [Myxococcales bacterium]